MVKFPKKLLQPIIKYLEKEKEKTQRRLSSLAKEDPFTDPSRLSDNAASDTDAKEQLGHLRIESLKKELSSRLEKIKKAIFRAKRGEYGVCERCGKMIDTERLAANPTAHLCVDCEKKLTQK